MSAMTTLCDRVVKWGIVALLVFTPQAFGTVEPWSIALMEWAIVGLFLVFGLGASWSGTRSGPSAPRLTGIKITLGAFLVYCALQTVPMPMAWLTSLSPGSAQMYQEVDVEKWNNSTEIARGTESRAVSLLPLKSVTWRPVSVQPRATLERIEMLATLGLLFFLVVCWADRVQRIVFLLGVVTAVGFLVALQGLVQYLTWNGKILWLRKVPPSSPFGPFVNHNHFAGYVEMIIPVAISLSLFLALMRREEGFRSIEPSGEGSLASRLEREPEEGGRLGKSALALFAVVILVVTLFLSVSWGGILSTGLSGFILFLLVGQRLAPRRLAWAVGAAIPPLVLALVIWIGPEEIKSQFGASGTTAKEASLNLRVMIWDSLLRNLRPYLWTGAGLGTFEASFAPFTPPGSARGWDRAHNDYLQLLWETGVLGFGLVLAGIFLFVKGYWWASLRARGHPLDLFRVGVAVSLLSIALHSLVDFNLQIGANGFLLALLSGILVSLHRCVEEDRSRRPTLVSPPQEVS